MGAVSSYCGSRSYDVIEVADVPMSRNTVTGKCDADKNNNVSFAESRTTASTTVESTATSTESAATTASTTVESAAPSAFMPVENGAFNSIDDPYENFIYLGNKDEPTWRYSRITGEVTCPTTVRQYMYMRRICAVLSYSVDHQKTHSYYQVRVKPNDEPTCLVLVTATYDKKTKQYRVDGPFDHARIIRAIRGNK